MASATTARALVVPRNGDSSVLEVQDVEVSPPGDGEVQVEVAAVGVNFIDVYQRQGVYPLTTPFVSCSEGAGTVTAVGAGVAGWEPGQRVGVGWNGGYCGYCDHCRRGDQGQPSPLPAPIAEAARQPAAQNPLPCHAASVSSWKLSSRGNSSKNGIDRPFTLSAS